MSLPNTFEKGEKLKSDTLLIFGKGGPLFLGDVVSKHS